MVQTQMLKKLIFYSFSLLSHIFISLCLVPLILFLCHSHSHSQPHHASTCLVGHLASLTTLPCLHLAKLNPLYLFLLSLSSLLICQWRLVWLLVEIGVGSPVEIEVGSPVEILGLFLLWDGFWIVEFICFQNGF